MAEQKEKCCVESENTGEHEDVLRILRQFHQILAARAVSHHELKLHVEALAGTVEAHFRHEEGAGGFFEEILGETPRLQHKIDLLRQQHAGLRTSLAELQKLAILHRSSCGRWQEMQLHFDEFLSQFLVHEGLEDALVQEAYDRDLGDSGDF